MSRLPERLLAESFTGEAVSFALKRNPNLANIDMTKVSGLVATAASEIATFEQLARIKPLRIPQTSEEARKNNSNLGFIRCRYVFKGISRR